MKTNLKVAVIGGGAAGFFAAICVKENYPNYLVTIYEQSKKLLSKVKISGGGRCNVTNGTSSKKELVSGYPRGAKLLKSGFQIFDNNDIMSWFESRGVSLKTEDDMRVFPVSDDSQTVIDCLLRETRKHQINIKTSAKVISIHPTVDEVELTYKDGRTDTFDKVIIASGGSPKREGLEWLEELGHTIVDPIPSLFSFNMPSEKITELMGVVADKAIVSIQGTKLKSQGPLLITHWGMSGPAILKLSSFGARILAGLHYNFITQINWTGEPNHLKVAENLLTIVAEHPAKKIQSIKPFQLPSRLWLYIIERCEMSNSKRWDELGKKGINKLVHILTNDIYKVNGKTTFKEEFVTSGGIALDGIHPKTMQSQSCPNLYFAGEVLDIDGITGGYNFQAAWTTAYLAGRLG